jgi:hypothetical protein
VGRMGHRPRKLWWAKNHPSSGDSKSVRKVFSSLIYLKNKK